eukprot:COSAG05_NODE_146_length_16405_cov_993.952104_7_plen_885_part_00
MLRIDGENLGLFFGGANDWACRSFEEELRELVQERGGLDFEILFCCSDALDSEAAFEEHLRELPCTFALPHADHRVAALARFCGLDLRNVPQLVLLDAEGEVSSSKGCEFVRDLLQQRRVDGALEHGNAALERTGDIDAFEAYFAFRQGLQYSPSHGPLIQGEADAQKKLPPPFLDCLPCSAGGWRFNVLETNSPTELIQAQTTSQPAEGSDKCVPQCPTCGGALAPLPTGLVQVAGDQHGACDGVGCDTSGTIAELKRAGYLCCLDCDFGLCTTCQEKQQVSSAGGDSATVASNGTDNANSLPDPLAEGGRALLAMHINSGTQVTVWEDAPGFFLRLPQKQSMREIRLKKPKTIFELCCVPHSHAPLPLAELAATAAMLSAETLPTMPSEESFAKLKSSEDTAVYVKNQLESNKCFTWGEAIHLANDVTPWLVRRFDDGGVLITDHSWRGGSLFLGPDGSIVFGGNVTSLPIRSTPNLGSYSWVQRRCEELLARSTAVHQSEPEVGPFATFGALLTLRQGVALDKKHAGLVGALEELTNDPARCVATLDVNKPQLFGKWLLSECATPQSSTAKPSSYLLLAHPLGVQLAFHRAGCFGFRMVVHGGRQWERQISDAGWQDFVPASPDAAAKAGIASIMPGLEAFQQAGEGVGAPQLLNNPAHERMCWSSQDGAEHWGLLRDGEAGEGNGLALLNVGAWTRAWLGSQPPCACVRILADGGVCLGDAEGGWTGLCVTPDALTLSADEAHSSLRLGGAPMSVGGWAIGVAAQQADPSALLPSIGGLLLCSHAATGQRVAFREYDHAFWYGECNSTFESDGVCGEDTQKGQASDASAMDELLDGGTEPPAAAQFAQVEELAVNELPPGASMDVSYSNSRSVICPCASC